MPTDPKITVKHIDLVTMPDWAFGGVPEKGKKAAIEKSVQAEKQPFYKAPKPIKWKVKQDKEPVKPESEPESESSEEESSEDEQPHMPFTSHPGPKLPFVRLKPQTMANGRHKILAPRQPKLPEGLRQAAAQAQMMQNPKMVAAQQEFLQKMNNTINGKSDFIEQKPPDNCVIQ